MAQRICWPWPGKAHRRLGGMLPSYPSLTLPNEFTIVTGFSFIRSTMGHWRTAFMIPRLRAFMHQAIWAQKAMLTGSAALRYGAYAESQGMRTASILHGRNQRRRFAEFLPAYSLKNDGKTDVPQAEIRQIVEWLRLPAEESVPISSPLYDPEVESAAKQLWPRCAWDEGCHSESRCLPLANWKSALDASGLPIDLVVVSVSDHGMAKTEGGWITLDKFADLTGFDSVDALLYGKSEADKERVYNQLKKASSDFVEYRLKNVPAGLHFNLNPRAGDPVVIATGPYAIPSPWPAGRPA